MQSVTDSRGPKTLTYSYSPGGLRNGVTDSDGNATTYVYDAVGRLIGIWAPTGDLVAFSHDAGGRLVEKNFPNGARTRYTYHADNTLARVSNFAGSSDASVLNQHDYTYDGVGNRLTHVERIGATTARYGYVYDPLNRLLEVRTDPATTNALVEAYTYDPLGNRLTKNTGGTVTYFSYDAANQLTQFCAGTPAARASRAHSTAASSVRCQLPHFADEEGALGDRTDFARPPHPTRNITACGEEEGNAVTTTRDLSGKPRTVTTPSANTATIVH